MALLGLLILVLLIARSITSHRYTEPLSSGRNIIDQIKQKGISSFLADLGLQSFFLIRNTADRTIGFTMDAFSPTAPDVKLNIQSTSLLYTRGRYAEKRIVFFKSNNSFDEFSWNTKSVGPRGSTDTEIVLRQDGVLTITRNNRNLTRSGYKPGPTAIPDFLLDLVFSQLLQSNHRKIIVDAINSDGQMVQVVISRRIPQDREPLKTKAAHELHVQHLDDPRRTQHVFFDAQGRIILVEQDGIYFERTDRQDALELFPEWRDYILDTNKTSEPNQP